ncbi:hypothetical protein [Kitasatospora azatica]|uniref:hypothetical protein n=1 Tax=Kitasatospora azatica TaxID=58347 RepID=UPI00068A221D|nr:hypothetical protein [Kitasatospora azatica]
MRHLLCQICGTPANRTEDGALWLLKDDRADWPGWPEGMTATHPPVCLTCAHASTRLCPHLQGGYVAVRAKNVRTLGVYGALYQPGPLGPRPVTDIITTPGDPRSRWVLAAQLVRVLRDCTFVDLEAPEDRTS